MRNLLFLFTLFCSIQSWAQLSDREIETLAERVRNNYEMMGVADGVRVYQTSRHRVLVCLSTIDSDMKLSEKNRQAELKATRAAREFLKGAKNKSITIYNAYSEKVETLHDSKGNSVNEGLGTIDSNTNSSINELSTSVEKETMSDKIIQESGAKLDGIQILMKFTGEDGETIYAHYLLISKKSAKKKH